MKGLVSVVLLSIVVLLFLILFFSPYPELKAYRSRSYGLVINDRNGVTLRVVPADDGVKREWASLGDIPAGALRVFIRAEDRRFYFHPGVDPIAVAGSALRNLRAGRIVSGGSTITMQLARLIRPRGPGLGGKAAEAWDALRLEARLSKKAILELWLNGIPFGSNIEGLPAMARNRFGQPVTQLDDTRAALLAAVPRRPGLYDPALNPEAAVRAALFLSRRLKLGLDQAVLEAVAREASPDADEYRSPFSAPHFTERLASDLRSGGNSTIHSVRSTLDLDLQSYAEELLQNELAMLTKNRVSNGAILAIDNETGAVRVYVGSRSWFDEGSSGKIDGVRVLNQPGSCLKPFLYAMALDTGFSPAEILPDIPQVFGGSEAYIPSNFNRRFNGPVRLRVALASSLNIPAVYILERLGVRSFEEFLVSLGFDSVAAAMGSHGTGLALGNAEVSLEELVRGFAVFPRRGIPVELQFIEDNHGNSNTTQVMSPYAAWVISDILSDRGSRFVAFGPAPVLSTSFPSMFKTGTANQFQHIWALGASARFTVGVWMGNFSGETVVGRTGSSIPARIAAELLAALEQSSIAAYTTGGGSGESVGGPILAEAGEIEICALAGMAATPYCTGTLREWIRIKETAGNSRRTQKPCSWHQAGELVYPPEYQAWLTERFRAGNTGQRGTAGYIRLPAPGSVFYIDPYLPEDAQALRVETVGFSLNGVVYVDDTLQGSLNTAGVFALTLQRGQHRLVVEDESGGSAAVDFEVR
ncbi:penicillin-binding protein 1C [Treponema primitia]|uniref:penicillin-binding protein 1C n=1 Tax=Treponema primitia TaxID=88058 RepID=UPI00025554F1|nr:penicillin-binding protein 1C [Treponema primitia]